MILSFVSGVRADALSAKACALICADTGEVIFSQNGNMKLAMASTTKIMTAYLLCKQNNLDRKVTVTKADITVEGTSMGLTEGDTVTLYDLLYGMMLPSGNDAAQTAARAIGGNINNFLGLMNAEAKALGLQNTSFETVSGLDGENHYTTALDLAKLTMHALKNKDFAKAVATKSITLDLSGRKITLTNHNRLVRNFDDVYGVKTGFTKKAGRCLVSAAQRDNKKVIFVTLNDGNDWQDHRTMLDMGLNALKEVNIKPNVDSISIPVSSGERITVSLKDEEYTFCAVDTPDTRCDITVPQILYAPVKKGDTIGKLNYTVCGNTVKTVYIKSNVTIKEKSTSKRYMFFDTVKYIIGELI